MIYISLTLSLSPFPSPFPSRWHPTVHKFQWKINIPVKAGLNLSIHEVCGNEIARLSHEIAMRMFCKSNLDLDQVSASQDLRRSEDSLLSNCVDSLLPNAPKCNGATVPIWPDLWTCFCSFFFFSLSCFLSSLSPTDWSAIFLLHWKRYGRKFFVRNFSLLCPIVFIL